MSSIVRSRRRSTSTPTSKPQRALDADVRDLKQGFEAIEERARSELGMIKHDEVFFQLPTRKRRGPPKTPEKSRRNSAIAASPVALLHTVERRRPHRLPAKPASRVTTQSRCNTSHRATILD